MHGIPGMMAYAAVSRHEMLWIEEYGMMTLERCERLQEEELQNNEFWAYLLCHKYIQFMFLNKSGIDLSLFGAKVAMQI